MSISKAKGLNMLLQDGAGNIHHFYRYASRSYFIKTYSK